MPVTPNHKDTKSDQQMKDFCSRYTFHHGSMTDSNVSIWWSDPYTAGELGPYLSTPARSHDGQRMLYRLWYCEAMPRYQRCSAEVE